MTLITNTDALENFIAQARHSDFLTIDTEFMRERTYWPRLCLIQVGAEDQAVAIDPLAEGIDLAPFYRFLNDSDQLKVFHAGRQDLEIFFHQTGKLPSPIFDTQVAAMVCGFGESVGYDVLVRKVTGEEIDKGSRFADWSHRPLSASQLSYALGDVTHLRPVYQYLRDRLEESGRAGWLQQEMEILTDPETYINQPREAWRRLKVKSDKPKFLAVLREIAAWREEEAQRRDVPRNRVLKDETLMDIAGQMPRKPQELGKIRSIPKGFSDSRHGEAILTAINKAMDLPAAAMPNRKKKKKELAGGIGPIVELLKVLLKLRCEQHQVAPKLVANAEDLQLLAADDEADILALKGWRREVFGEDALALKQGRLGLRIENREVEVVEFDPEFRAAS